MLAPTGYNHLLLIAREQQRSDQVEDQWWDEQPEEQEQRPVWRVAPAVLHPPGNDYRQEHVDHPERVHPIRWRAGPGLEQLAKPTNESCYGQAGHDRCEDAYVAKRIQSDFVF